MYLLVEVKLLYTSLPVFHIIEQLKLRVVFAIGESRASNTWDQSDQP